MIPWAERSFEERSLLNPCFCGMLIWHAALGYRKESERAISLEESFLVLPLVLHRGTRDALPRDVRTSLAVWIQEHPLVRGRLAERARSLAPYTKEALLFSGCRGVLLFSGGSIEAERAKRRAITSVLRVASAEVADCAKRSIFVGRWFARAGGPSTVLALWGVKP